MIHFVTKIKHDPLKLIFYFVKQLSCAYMTTYIFYLFEREIYIFFVFHKFSPIKIMIIETCQTLNINVIFLQKFESIRHETLRSSTRLNSNWSDTYIFTFFYFWSEDRYMFFFFLDKDTYIL